MDNLSTHLSLHLRFKRKKKKSTDAPAEPASVSYIAPSYEPPATASLESIDPSEFEVSVVSVEAEIQNSTGDVPKRVPSTKRYALFAESLIYSWNNIMVTTSEPIFKPRVLWNEITDVDQPSKQTSSPLCGVAYSGEILAVLGGSGVGKSTLLNILSFRHSSRMFVEGDRCINGIMVDHRIVHEISSYLQERDVFPPLVTVREHLVFNAMLRTKFESTYFERVQRVDHMLRELGLWDVRNEIIGSGNIEGRKGISRAARKMLSLAAELLSDPRIIFCECPTKHLDAGNAQWVMSELRKVASKGNMVICTFYRPSTEIYCMCDRICLMSKGRIAFHGTPAEALKFWNELGYECPMRYNPFDYFVSTLVIDPENEEASRERVEQITRMFHTSAYYSRMQNDATLRHWKTVSMARLEKRFFKDAARYKTNWCTQLIWCCRREMTILLRSTGPLYGRLFISALSALMYGIIFWNQPTNDLGVQATASFFTATMIQILTTSCAYAILSVGKDFEVLVRENYKRIYRASSFYVAKNLCDLPANCLSPFIFVVISYYMVGLGGLCSKAVRYGYTTLLTATFSASGVGYFIFGLTGSKISALGAISTDVIHYVFCSGLFINTETTLSFVGFLHNISISYQIMENLMITQYDETEIQPVNSSMVHFRNGDGIFNFYMYDKRDLWQNYTALFGFCIVGIRLMAFLPFVIRLYLHRRFYPDI